MGRAKFFYDNLGYLELVNIGHVDHVGNCSYFPESSKSESIIYIE